MLTLSIYTDYKEDRWESMDLYTNLLILSLEKQFAETIKIRRSLAFENFSSLCRSNKYIRYIFRYIINPLTAPCLQGDINHIVDQSNAHLLRRLNPEKTVITIHDLIVPLWEHENPSFQSEPTKGTLSELKHRIKMWRISSLIRAKYLIAVSEATKTELVRKIGIEPARITVIPEYVENFFQPIKNAKALDPIKIKYGLPDSFILHVGTCAPYKNIPMLLQIFSEIVRQNSNVWLIKTGSPWANKHVRLIRKLGIESRIKHLGFIPRKDLPYLYSLSRCLIFPSLVEGFGLPVLEAMRCGCPVVISDTPALQELVDNTGITIGRRTMAQLITRINRILRENNQRNYFGKIGQKRASYFTAKRSADKTYQVYSKMITAQTN